MRKKEEDESNKNTSHPNSLSSLDLREVKNLGDPRDRLKTQLQLIDYLIFFNQNNIVLIYIKKNEVNSGDPSKTYDDPWTGSTISPV